MQQSHLAWFRALVREAQDDLRPAAQHAQVMETTQKVIDEKCRS